MSDNNKSCSAMGALVMGVAMGALAILLAHEPTRKKMKGRLMDAIEKGDEKLEQVTNKVKDARVSMKKKAVKELNRAERKLS